MERQWKCIAQNIEFEIELRITKDDVNLNLKKYHY